MKIDFYLLITQENYQNIIYKCLVLKNLKMILKSMSI